MLYLRDDFKQAWQGKDVQAFLETMDGEVFRELEARRTFRFEFNGKGYFAKVHMGVGWKEILESILRLRRPVLGARDEWEALTKLKSIGVETMTTVGFGEAGFNPAKQRSFLITEELENMITLEDFCETWKENPPSVKLKWAIVQKLAEISKVMHDNGMNHRDYYLCHFMMPKEGFPDNKPIQFYMIDLHRAMIHQNLPERWRLKDLSGLYFSAMDYGFTSRDILRFLKIYSGLPLREALSSYKTILSAIEHKAHKLYRRMERKAGHPNY
ncbi:lipopolysaccharide core heptose(I) kinase RfaP [Endozoicomonas sp. OPT23]|uniref:lipopolysaccharide core heptose(I) kinase RfaP n=1 Tax=Endozoicomonas sp. OPT23 TaxID=2072845 RepID=UPI00129B97A8|nr:lipopolysaccharide core heptose(I) kinase RfaP [Endozoicomonas sp. OPT23]MRI31611.1 lipopolysaccharide core heptose(I) kinase RfaP [Endozoicomonas sp. OPT23]